MTFLYPERPLTEAAPALLDISQPVANGEIIRHILIGSPEGVREAIHVLHIRRYVEQGLWSGLVAIGEKGVTITQTEGQVLSYLIRQRSLDRPIA
ncbi:MAG: hypothetical protein WBA10_05170 [Elainellaceae cyanobacterium]